MRAKITSVLSLLLFLFVSSVSAQQVTVSGVVTSSEDGLPLPGVSVIVVGTTTGTATDFDGNYSISANAGDRLQFSFIGYSNETFVVGESTLNVVLSPDAEQLEEVVVTALGIKKSKKALGYAVTEVKTDDMEKVPVVDVTEGLKGKIAGVNISSSSGSPGASTSVIIRGVSSLTGSNQPLYVIDGIPINNNYSGTTGSTNSVDFGNAASDINPSDVLSMSILKGAAATSLYGSRAANGAVIITTKSGQKGKKMKIAFSSSTSLDDVGRLPYYQDIYGQGWSGSYDSKENGSWGPKLDGVERLTGNVVNGAQRLKPFSFQENGLRDFYEYGYTAQNSIAASGGTDVMGYYLSYANTNQDGVVPGDKDKLNRHTFTFKGNGGTEKTKIDFGATYTGKKISAVSTGQGDDAGAGKSLFQEILQNPVDMYVPMFRDYNSPFDNLDNYYTPYAQNPYFIINENGNNMISNRINSYINLNQELAKGLNLMWRGGLDIANTFTKRYGAIAKISEGAENASAQSVAGAVTDEQKLIAQYNSDLILTYNTVFGIGEGELNFRATLGNNINQIDYARSTTNSKGLVVPDYYNVANISGSANVSSYEYRKRVVGIFGTIDLDWNSTLFLQLTARNDYSSTLPADNNSFFYPGVNLGFVFTDLLPDNNILSYGKLRTSYALAGNDAPVHSINAYYSPAVIGAYYGATIYPVGGVAAYEKGNLLGNPNLSPEISNEFEIGGDLRFFGNRVGIDAAYYNKVTNDLIMQADIASSSGYTSQTTNLGKITNTGIELVLTASPVKTNNFNWDLTYVYTKSNTILNELSEELGVSEYVIYSAYQTEFVAIPGEQLGQFRIPDYKRTETGEIIVGDNGLPLEGDKVNYATSVPDYKMSLGNTFTYNNLSLSFMFDYQHGGSMYSYTSNITFWSGNNEQSLTNNRRPYVVPNSVQEAGVVDGEMTYVENSTPVHNNWHEYYSGNTNRPIESTRIIDKTFLKLRDVSLSYKISPSFTERFGVESANLSVFGRNLFLWTPASNSFVDPETSTYGNDLRGMFGEFGGAPSTRTYGIKLNLLF